MKLSATEAKNHLGRVLEQAQHEPVVIEKAGRRHSVVLSADQYDALVAASGRAATPQGGAGRFYAEHKDWVDAVNLHNDEHGLWNEAVRTW